MSAQTTLRDAEALVAANAVASEAGWSTQDEEEKKIQKFASLNRLIPCAIRRLSLASTCDMQMQLQGLLCQTFSMASVAT